MIDTIRYDTIQYSAVCSVVCSMQWSVQCSAVQCSALQRSALRKDPEQGVLFGFSTPEQGGKFKTPVAHTHLIKVEFSLTEAKMVEKFVQDSSCLFP